VVFSPAVQKRRQQTAIAGNGGDVAGCRADEPCSAKNRSGQCIVKLAIIATVLICITIAVLCLYHPTYATTQLTVTVRPLPSRNVGVNFMVKPPIPDAALSNYCSLHAQARSDAIVPLAYGTPPPDASYAHRHAQQTLFPNAWSYVYAGCMGYTATQTVVRYCPQCRVAERRWKREHE